MRHSMNKPFPLTGITLVTLALSSCGGGGGGGGPIAVQNPAPSLPTSDYRVGVFEPASDFKSRCRAPRFGTNPITNSPYGETQGTTTDENNFLRSYSNDTYLWYSEISDQNPENYSDTLQYFDQLKTFAVTPSGAQKDRFHFTYDSDEWFQLSQSGVSAGYGAQFVFLSSTPPRNIVVAYTEPNSPATSLGVNLTRGTRLLSIDGVDIDSTTSAGIDTLNAGLFPSNPGERHSFTVRDVSSGTVRSVTMTAEVITSAPVQNTKVIVRPDGARVGYFSFNDHIATAEQELIDAVNLLNSGAGIDDLILDVRYNGGGYLAIASELAYMIAGTAATTNKAFETLQFNDKHMVTNPVTGALITPTAFYSNALGPPFNAPEGQPLPTLNLDRVYVITGSSTCSASEAIMNGLQGIDVEVIQIGSTTCGKPYGFYATSNCGTTYFTAQFRAVNNKGFGNYTDGFSPSNTQASVGTVVTGCSVADDFTRQMGDVTESRLATALNYRESGTCPVATGFAPGIVGKSGAPLNQTEGLVPKSPWLTNRILDR